MDEHRQTAFPDVGSLSALQGDLAGKYRASASMAAAKVDPAVLAADLEALSRDGYVILRDVVPREEMAAIKREMLPALDAMGRNAFEGLKTQRLYAVLEKTRAADRLVDHPRILALLDAMFLPNYLLSQLQVINILPRETAQYLHPDDGFYRVARPRPALGAATVWAVDDFTEENGATTVIPGSHRWLDGRAPAAEDERRSAAMSSGSVVFYPGTLWHGGGANRSRAARMGITCQYCEPWLRQQENFFLSVSKETVRAVSEDIRRMLGYSVYPPFMGMVNGMHPKRVLEEPGSV